MGQIQDATDDLDFKLLRAQSYIENVTFGRLSETVKLVDLQQKVPLITNIALRHVLFDSFFGHRLRKERKKPTLTLRGAFTVISPPLF